MLLSTTDMTLKYLECWLCCLYFSLKNPVAEWSLKMGIIRSLFNMSMFNSQKKNLELQNKMG